MPAMIVIGYRDDLDRALRNRGLNPFYIVQSPAIPPQGIDFTVVTDIENAHEILRAALAARIDDVAGVLSVHEMGVFGAAYLRQQLNLPGNSDSRKVLDFRDKYLQKNALPPHIRRARCRYVPPGTSYADLAAEFGDVFVIKPANGGGSLRTTVVRSPELYEQALGPFPDRSDVAVVAESFIDAPEFYVDGVWGEGRLQWSTLVRYRASPLSAAQGGIMAAYILDRRLHTALFQQAEALTEQVLSSLEAPDCVFHLEIFDEADGLTFGECALRLSGGLSPRCNELTFGVNLFDIEISLALGEGVPHIQAAQTPERFHAHILLRSSSNGGVTRADFERNFTIDEMDYRSSPGTRVGPYGMVGYAIVSDTDEATLQKKVDDIVRFNEAC
ncbi:acetyl-CoA carboxylase biotin carboxylase subunit family protein [Streptomyces sp. NPDC059002]|uniref:ATP-grasp domain-containing protein n=1 Tax=Streptomyces sp. NPDC059002 TaxID=3346690 RepID=UPI003676E850